MSLIYPDEVHINICSISQVVTKINTIDTEPSYFCEKNLQRQPLFVRIFEVYMFSIIVVIPVGVLIYTYSNIYLKLRRVVLANEGVSFAPINTSRFENMKNFFKFVLQTDPTSFSGTLTESPRNALNLAQPNSTNLQFLTDQNPHQTDITQLRTTMTSNGFLKSNLTKSSQLTNKRRPIRVNLVQHSTSSYKISENPVTKPIISKDIVIKQ